MDGAVFDASLLRSPGVPATRVSSIEGVGGTVRNNGGPGETTLAWETDLADSVHNFACALILPMTTLLAATMAFSVFAGTPQDPHDYVPSHGHPRGRTLPLLVSRGIR